MTALFVVIFVEQWIKEKQYLASIIGIVITTACLLIFKADNFLIPSMILISASLFIMRKWISKVNKNDR